MTNLKYHVQVLHVEIWTTVAAFLMEKDALLYAETSEWSHGYSRIKVKVVK